MAGRDGLVEVAAVDRLDTAQEAPYVGACVDSYPLVLVSPTLVRVDEEATGIGRESASPLRRNSGIAVKQVDRATRNLRLRQNVADVADLRHQPLARVHHVADATLSTGALLGLAVPNRSPGGNMLRARVSLFPLPAHDLLGLLLPQPLQLELSGDPEPFARLTRRVEPRLDNCRRLAD